LQLERIGGYCDYRRLAGYVRSMHTSDVPSPSKAQNLSLSVSTSAPRRSWYSRVTRIIHADPGSWPPAPRRTDEYSRDPSEIYGVITSKSEPSVVSMARNLKAGVVDVELHREGVPAFIHRSRRRVATPGSTQLNQVAPPAPTSMTALARTRALVVRRESSSGCYRT
jgi:hypothetical protein